LFDSILLGGRLVAKNDEVLENTQISVVVNVTNSVKNYFEGTEFKVEYYRVPVEDGRDEPIINYFPNVVEFISKKISENKKVLVHCQEGQSRSPTVIIAWMMSHYKMDLKTAYEKFISLVGENTISINDGFKQQLMDWDHTLYQHHSMSFTKIKRRSSIGLLNENPVVPQIPAN